MLTVAVATLAVAADVHANEVVVNMYTAQGGAAAGVQPREVPEHPCALRAGRGQGWPRIMVVNRKATDARRDRLLEGIPTNAGFDRDG